MTRRAKLVFAMAARVSSAAGARRQLPNTLMSDTDSASIINYSQCFQSEYPMICCANTYLTATVQYATLVQKGAHLTNMCKTCQMAPQLF